MDQPGATIAAPDRARESVDLGWFLGLAPRCLGPTRGRLLSQRGMWLMGGLLRTADRIFHALGRLFVAVLVRLFPFAHRQPQQAAPPSRYMKLLDSELQAVGRIIVTYAMIEFHVENVLGFLMVHTQIFLLQGFDGKMFADGPMKYKLSNLKWLVKTGLSPEIEALHKEFRWAMATVTKTRNMLAHGIVLTADNGDISFWSQQRLKEMPMGDLTRDDIRVVYAHQVAQHMSWAVRGITPPYALPHRPS